MPDKLVEPVSVCVCVCVCVFTHVYMYMFAKIIPTHVRIIDLCVHTNNSYQLTSM